MLAVGVLAGFLLLASTTVAGVIIARHRAGAAADLAALAAVGAATGLSRGAGPDTGPGRDPGLGATSSRQVGAPCAAAQRVAIANGVLLSQCRVGPGESVTVDVRVRPIGALVHQIWIRASARAGPGRPRVGAAVPP
jgi:hypothetical protein